MTYETQRNGRFTRVRSFYPKYFFKKQTSGLLNDVNTTPIMLCGKAQSHRTSCFPALGLHRLPETQKVPYLSSLPAANAHPTTSQPEGRGNHMGMMRCQQWHGKSPWDHATGTGREEQLVWYLQLTNHPQNRHIAGPWAPGRCKNFSKSLFHWNPFSRKSRQRLK